MNRGEFRRKMIGVAPAAERLGLSVWTLRNWCYRGVCSSHKIGNRLMLDEVEIERIIADSERPRIVNVSHDAA